MSMKNEIKNEIKNEAKNEAIEPYTKKCTTKILDKVLKVDPKAKKTTTFDQAWVILAEKYNMEGSLEYSSGKGTRFILYKDNNAVHEFHWEGRLWNDKECDFEWNTIYKEVLEWCISVRMFKKGKWNPKEIEHIDDSEETTVVEEQKEFTIDDYKKELQHLSARKSNVKKTGKDATEIEAHIAEVKAKIAELKSKA